MLIRGHIALMYKKEFRRLKLMIKNFDEHCFLEKGSLMFDVLSCGSTTNESKGLVKACFDVIDDFLYKNLSSDSVKRMLELIDFIDKYPAEFTAKHFFDINKTTFLHVLSNCMTYLIVVYTWPRSK
uniref:Uncharacterized protein LOC114345777 isoform X2 n=1 Tax=Diabrotica virgifera virgifera TaxID=50390 RepID=A0A6P7GS59_DIAVI